MARTLLSAGDVDIIAGEGHPRFPDTKNRYLREIWADYLEEHTIAGGHLAPYDSYVLPEVGTYQGNGTSKAVVFAITGFTAILGLVIWSEVDGKLYFKTTAMTNTKTSSNEAPITDGITALSLTGFTVGANVGVNTNATDYYYLVLGQGPTQAEGDQTSPPSWIADGVTLEGGDVTKNGNSVEYDLDTQYLVEHTIDTGAHTSAAFSGIAKGEAGIFSPTNDVTQTVSLDDEDLDIKFALFLPNAIQHALWKLETLSTLRTFGNAALSGGPYVSLGTGSFTLTQTASDAQFTFFELLSNAGDGTSVFTDTSSFGHTITKTGTVTHSTTQQHTDASSIRFNAAQEFLSAQLSDNGLYYGALEFTCEIFSDFSLQNDNCVMSVGLTNHNHYLTLSIASDGSLYAYFVNVIDEAVVSNVLNKAVTDGGVDVTGGSVWKNIKLTYINNELALYVETVFQDSITYEISEAAGSEAEMTYYLHNLRIGTGYNLAANPWRSICSTADEAAGQMAYLDDIRLKVTQPFWRYAKHHYVVLGV